MKKLVIFLLTSLLLVNFVYAGITASAINNNSDDKDDLESNGKDNDENLRNRVEARLTDEERDKIIAERNRIRITAENGECPERCTCEGSVTKCQIRNGTREMTISAGSSGNIIVQVKGTNASTNVKLYGSDEKIYGIFRNNETREIKIFPDEVRERIRERIQARLENQTIELDNDGIYQVELRKRARLFGLFSVRERVNAEVDSETGEIIRVRDPWWGFLAADEKEE